MARTASNVRITLWFKIGARAETPESEGESEGKPEGELAAGSMLLPIEDRYLDDGSVTREDSQLFSLRSGHTQALARRPVVASGDDGRALDQLVREMKRGRRKTVALLGAAAATLCGAALLIVL